MKLWLGRHCFAGDASPDPKKERERPLKPEGVAMAKAIAAAMLDVGEMPKVIFCSPYTRTRQTADIYAAAFNATLTTDDWLRVSDISSLAPDRPLDNQIIDLIRDDGAGTAQKRIMIVGHVDNTGPAMNAFGGDWKDLVMGEVRRVKIDRDTGEWKLKWGLKPSDLGLKDYK